MRRTIGALTLSAALAATGAIAENTTSERRAQLAELWGTDGAVGTDSVAATTVRTNFTGIGQQRREYVTGPWATNFRGGRKHPPAGH